MPVLAIDGLRGLYFPPDRKNVAILLPAEETKPAAK